MKIENVAIGRVASVAEAKKIIRLADVGELEADLKKDLAEEEAKGKAADVLYCESISDELSDLGNLPTIDPESLRGHARWVKNENVKIITVDVYGNTFESPVVYCENCNAALSEADFKGRVWNYCPVCGFIMEDATNE
nr:MAG TPA: RimK-related lysine biosynthesis protein, Probable-dependent amine/thiol ligase family Amino-group [Caudoviricetes sp.]